MPIILLIYLLAAIAIFLLPARTKPYKPLLIAFYQLLLFGYFLEKTSTVFKGSNVTSSIEWLPQLGINLDFSLDGLSLIFALLITGIGSLVFLYAKAYMKSYPGTDKFYFNLTIFAGAMLGLVLSVNMIQLFIFWELTSIMSFLLISFFHEKDASRKAAFQALFITALGGLSLLSGFILIGSITGSYHLNDWIVQGEMIRSHPLYLPSLILILIGAFTKSAQFPFHFWLPGAMQAPTPVSAYLHSATMVKAGIFLLFRLNPVLGGTAAWTFIIPLIGAITMLVGAYFSITQTDLKSILAYTTISALGIFVLLLGIDTKISFKAALVFLFVHAFYKAALFMLTGTIDKKAGTREINKLGGLRKNMPLTFIVAALALFSMAGLPPMLGFLGKELIYEAKIQSPGIASLILILGVTANIFMVAVSLFFLYKVFLGQPGNSPKKPDEKGLAFLLGPSILAGLSLGLGLFPEFLRRLLETALSEIHYERIEVKLKLWHGFNQVFFLSLFTIASGIFLFLLVSRKKSILPFWRKFNRIVFGLKFSELFSSSLDKMVNLSRLSTKKIQHGYHRYYLMTILVFASLLLWFQIYITRGWDIESVFTLKPFYISGLVLVIAIASLFSIVVRSRIVTIISMGVVGYGISLIYLYYSAVDLAITQILVETLTVVMFVLILQRLPQFARLSSRRTKIRDFLIALSFGSVMTILALKAIHLEFSTPISDYFTQNSYLKAYGRNVVNVILVDFRAFDTLGEITVLAIAALGVYSLLKLKKQQL